MTLVDTSAWVEWLRGTGSDTHLEVRRLLDRASRLHTTEVVVMEVLAGARHDDEADNLGRLLRRCEFVPSAGVSDYEEAAAIYRSCRRNGRTVRKMNDCLISAVAIRNHLPVLHADRDFEAIAQHTALRLHRIP